jgi:hypothetical protein
VQRTQSPYDSESEEQLIPRNGVTASLEWASQSAPPPKGLLQSMHRTVFVIVECPSIS